MEETRPMRAILVHPATSTSREKWGVELLKTSGAWFWKTQRWVPWGVTGKFELDERKYFASEQEAEAFIAECRAPYVPYAYPSPANAH